MKLIVPARANSKGLKHKNRILFKYIEGQITPWKDETIVTTDDDQIIKESINLGLKTLEREECLAYGLPNKHSVRHRNYYLNERKDLKYKPYNKKLRKMLIENDLYLPVEKEIKLL